MGDYRKKSVSFEGTLSAEQVIKYLEGLAAALKAGTVTLEHGGDSVSLHPARAVNLSIEAKRKEDRERISLEIGWVREQEAVDPELKIHDREASPRDDFYDDECDDNFENEESNDDDEDREEPTATPGAPPPESILIGSDDAESEHEEEENRDRKKKKNKKK